MQKTENYQLNQWDKTDRIMMEDFNADNAKIDAALKAANDAAAEAAASGVKFVVGSYTGNGSTSPGSYATETQHITLGFQPQVVFVSCGNDFYASNGGGFFTRANPIATPMDIPAGAITETGFTVGQICYGGAPCAPNLNMPATYHYIAFG